MAHKKTIMPTASIWPPLIFLFLILAISAVLFFFVNKWIASGIIAIFAILLPSIVYGDVKEFHGLILVNKVTGSMRGIFPGLNLKWPWEKPEKNEEGNEFMRDLRVEFEEVVHDTYITSGGAKMDVSYVFTFRTNIEHNPSRNLVIFASFEPNAIKAKGKGIFSQLLSDYYRSKTLEDIFKTSKPQIEQATFYTGTGQTAINNFSELHGAETTLILKDSDLDEATQSFYVKVAQSEAIGKQFENYKRQKISAKQAQRLIELANFENVTYDHDEINLVIKAEDLKNLQQFSFTPLGGMLGQSQKGKKSKT